MKKNRKWIALTACALVACLALAGCMNTGNRVTPDADPSASATQTATPGNGTGMMPGAPSEAPAGFDWITQGNGVEQKINMLSEIQSSRVVVTGATALVGVSFANQYKGEMTQRIRDMVAGEVQAADPTIQTVAVTAEEEDVKNINQIADKIAAGTPVSELEGEIDAIVRNVTTIQ